MATLKLIRKMDTITSTSTLVLSVSKKDGPVATTAEVGSTGSDDMRFTDTQLTPGPAQMPLNGNNSYSVVWSGAFVKAGSVTLKVQVLKADGSVHSAKNVTVKGEKGDVFFRLVMIP